MESGLGGGPALSAPPRTRIALPFQLQWPDGLWHTLAPVMGFDGKPAFMVSDAGEGDVPGRFRPAFPFQLQWPDGLWRSLVPIMGSDGKAALSISENPEN